MQDFGIHSKYWDAQSCALGPSTVFSSVSRVSYSVSFIWLLGFMDATSNGVISMKISSELEGVQGAGGGERGGGACALAETRQGKSRVKTRQNPIVS